MSDAALLDEVATLVGRHADTLRLDTTMLARAVGGCEWDGPAARRFRRDASAVLRQLRAVAGHLDDAADELRRHAR